MNSQRLKRWESPRREGRNDKGRGGSARQRQLKKQTQMLRQRLKEGGERSSGPRHHTEKNKKQGEDKLILSPIFLVSSLISKSIQFLEARYSNPSL